MALGLISYTIMLSEVDNAAFFGDVPFIAEVAISLFMVFLFSLGFLLVLTLPFSIASMIREWRTRPRKRK